MRIYILHQNLNRNLNHCNMKKLLFILLVFAFNVNFAQKIDSKHFSETTNVDGNESIIKSSTVIIAEGKAVRVFEIESAEEGNYYLGAWMTGAKNKGGKLSEYDLKINDKGSEIKFATEKDEWHAATFKNKSKGTQTLKLNKGKNSISFSCDLPAIPEIEFLKLSKDASKVLIPDNEYKEYVNNIKKELSVKKFNQVEITDTLSDKLKSTILSNPNGDYYHVIGVPFRYTTYKTFYFNSGQQVYFSTHASSGYTHVLEVFSYDHPDAYTWVSLSSGGLASVNVNIPATGNYFVRVRAWQQGTQGLVDLNVNGQYYYTNCPVSGNGIAYPHETPTTYDYYTCKTTADTRIWIEDDGGIPGKIRAWNDDYYTTAPHDFYWGTASRVKKDFGVRIKSVLISAYSSSSPLGTCDVYIKCNPLSTYTTGALWWKETHTPILENFPYIKADDAIHSAPSTNVYNCASWAGGITDGWFWGCKGPSRTSSCNSLFYGSAYSWYTWDDYFGNNPPRYNGAMTYTRDGATASNASVAVWSTNEAISGVTHFSVKNYANNHPHGYDWESKPGELERIFHPMNALREGSYGNIFDYYTVSALKSASAEKMLTYDESVALGLTIKEKIGLSYNEGQKLKTTAKSKDFSELELLFNNWLPALYNTDLAANSNPYKYFENDEFYPLYDYCIKNEASSILFFAEKLFSDELTRFESEIISILFCGFAAKNYSDLLEEVKNESRLKNYTAEGVYIAPDGVNNTKKFIKKILFEEENSEDVNKYDGAEYLNIYPNPIVDQSTIFLKLDGNDLVSIFIYDMKGAKIKTIVNNKEFNSGRHSIEIDSHSLSAGNYLCKVQIGNNAGFRKIIVK